MRSWKTGYSSTLDFWQYSVYFTYTQMQDVEEELADTFIYLIRLADTLAVDHLRAAESKLKQNRDKYPADIVRGNSAKYTEYNE